jgi:hypothetical protein
MLEKEAAEKLTYDLKPQLAALGQLSKSSRGARLGAVRLAGRLVDVRIAAWLVTPDEAIVSDNPNNIGSRVSASPLKQSSGGTVIGFSPLIRA